MAGTQDIAWTQGGSAVPISVRPSVFLRVSSRKQKDYLDLLGVGGTNSRHSQDGFISALRSRAYSDKSAKLF